MTKIKTHGYIPALLMTAAYASSAMAADSADLESRLAELESKLATMEQSSVTSSDKGGFVIGDTTVSIGGYVKADMVYKNHGNVGANATIFARQHVAAVDEDAESTIDMTARESRLWVKTSSMQGGKPLTTYMELDFYGSDGSEMVSNNFDPRLRHAYGSWGNLLIGQTWSTFVDPAHFGELNAFGQHASTIFIRQTQVRYTQPFSGGSVMLALENPQDGDDTSKTPDMVVRVNFDGDWGHASLGALGRELSDGDDQSFESAYSLTAKLNLPTGGDIRAQYNTGNLGRYMGVAAYPDEDATATDLSGFESTGYSVALRHPWSKQFASNVMYSATEADSDVSIGGLESSSSLHVNLMYYATPKIRFGAEYAQWETESLTAAGTDDKSLDVVQLSTRFLF
ncbi:MAG: porin [Pseudomonadota bacterium]|nr:porin [Pseudomonadota bacterium]